MRGLGADRAHNQRHQHARLQTVTRHIADDNQNASICAVWKNLEEVAPNLPRRTIFAFNRQARNHRQLLRDQNLLHLLCLFNIQLPLFALPLRSQKPSQQQHRDDSQRKNNRDLTYIDRKSEREKEDRHQQHQ